MLQRKSLVVLLIAFVMTSSAFSQSSSQPTLKIIQDRGYLKCGISQGLPGFSSPDDKGHWEGLDVDFCKAVASAIFNDVKKVQFVPLSAKERFTALQSGEVDLLARNTTWTFIRDTSLGIDFVGINYYDGQGFMVRKALNLSSVHDLNGATICTNTGTTTELNIADYFQSHGLKYQVLAFEKTDETLAAYEAGRCDAYSTDASGLAAQRLKLANKADHTILPEIISKEPLAPAVRQGDDQFANIARWTLYAMINAEELGVTQKNVKEQLKSKDPNIQRLLGVNGGLGERLGLKNDWAYHIMTHVGNYADSYDRNLGKNSPLNIQRGVNALWKEGGILYAPPMR